MVSRVLGFVAVVSVVVASLVVPLPASPGPDADLPVPRLAAVAVCPVTVDRSSTGSVVLSSAVPGEVRSVVYAAGRQISEGDVVIDATGGVRVGFDQLVVSGLAGLLAELPGGDVATGITVAGLGLGGANCTAPSSATTIAVGVSTRGGEQVDLILVNPYAVDAVVSVSSSSEAGIDSAGELETVVVPSGSVVTRDLAALLPLRNRLSVAITADTGQVHGFLVQQGGTDRAFVEAVTPQASWQIPLAPAMEAVGEVVVVASSSSVDIPVRVDGLVDGRWVDGLWSATIAARSQVEFSLTDLDPRPAALRIGADGLIVPSLVMESEAIRATAPAVPFASTDWFISVTGEGELQAIVAAAGEFDASVTFFPHAEGGSPIMVDVPQGGSALVPLPAVDAGYAVRATSEVLVMWRSSVEGGIALGAAVPVEGLGE